MTVLKNIVDNLMNKIGTGLIFIANVSYGKVNFICRSNIDINAGNLVKEASLKAEGNGGGSATFASGLGKTSAYLEEIFANIKEKLGYK